MPGVVCRVVHGRGVQETGGVHDHTTQYERADELQWLGDGFRMCRALADCR